MIEVNLIPDIKREYLRTRMLRNSVIAISVLVGGIAIAITIVLGMVAGGQLIAEGVKDNDIKKQEKALLSVSDLDKTVTLQNQLEVISKTHGEKNVDSRLFSVISAINPAEQGYARISNLKYDTSEKTINIEGWTESHVSLEAFKKTILNTKIHYSKAGDTVTELLTDEIISDPSSFGLNSEGRRVLRFSFSFTYPDGLFMSSDEPVVVEALGKKTDVTDSKVGVPDNLFDSQASGDGKGEN